MSYYLFMFNFSLIFKKVIECQDILNSDLQNKQNDKEIRLAKETASRGLLLYFFFLSRYKHIHYYSLLFISLNYIHISQINFTQYLLEKKTFFFQLTI